MTSSRFDAAQLAAFHDSYQRDGVVRLPDLLAADWVARLDRALQRARRTLTARVAVGQRPGGPLFPYVD